MSKIVTTSKLNRLWKNGIKPIETNLKNLINSACASSAAGGQFSTLDEFVAATNRHHNSKLMGNLFNFKDIGGWGPKGGVNWYRCVLAYQNGYDDNITNDIGGCGFMMTDNNLAWQFYITGNKPAGNLKITYIKLDASASMISSYSDLMANTVAGYHTDALAIRHGFSTLNTNMNKVETYVGSDGKLHFVNASGVDTALNFSRGSGEAFRFIENVGYGRTDYAPGFANGYMVSLNSNVVISSSSINAGVITKYGNGVPGSTDSAIVNNAVSQGNYQGSTSGYTFDKCLEHVTSSFVNTTISHTVKGIKRGVTIVSIPVKDASVWYVRYVVVMVV